MEDSNTKSRQIKNLENLVENHTRTKRHLEQYSHIGDEENKDNAREKQEIREGEIQNLERNILNNEYKTTPQEELENVKQNYRNAQGYIQNNKDHLNQEMISNMEEKQQNRRTQIENLEGNIN